MRAWLKQTGNKQTTTKSQAKQKISGPLLWGYSDLLLCPASVLLTWPSVPLHTLLRIHQASWLSGSFSPFNQMAQLEEPSLAGVHNTRATGHLCRGAGGGCRGPAVVQTQVSAKQILSTLLLPLPAPCPRCFFFTLLHNLPRYTEFSWSEVPPSHPHSHPRKALQEKAPAVNALIRSGRSGSRTFPEM